MEPDVERSYQSVIPSRSIHKIHERTRLRVRQAKPKFFLCSMCKTHCFDTDHSDIEHLPASQERKETTPSIKISYKNADGQSIMDIVPQKLAKIKRKHRSKHKKNKKSRHNEEAPERPRTENSHHSITSSELNADTQHDSYSDTDNKLVIDLPEEAKAKTIVTSVAASNNAEKRQKARKTKNVTKLKTAEETSIVSLKNTRNVSTYEGSNGKIISVGDVIWGKIIGFPWWPGRVCAIAVTETDDGIVSDYVADIDWYCSPTKSHLSCTLLYPFLEDFEKR